MNRRSFLESLAALLAFPKVMLAKAKPAFKLSPIGKRWDLRAGEVLKPAVAPPHDGVIVGQAKGRIAKGAPVVRNADGTYSEVRVDLRAHAEVQRLAREFRESAGQTQRVIRDQFDLHDE